LEPAAGSSRTGRNLPVAIAVGAALGAVTIASLYFVKVLFLAVVIVAVGIGVTELVRSFAARGINVPLVPALVGMTVMIGGAYWGGTAWLLGSFAMTVLLLMFWRMFQGVENYVRDITATILVLVYPSLLAGFAALLLAVHGEQGNRGADLVLVFIATTVASDIGGYFAGISFGKHKMSSLISPKKTWEGFAGSVVVALVAGVLLAAFMLQEPWWFGLIFGATIVFTATIGDLVESLIKRDLGIKDISTWLPGHGGFLDRLDSVLPSAAAAYILFLIVG
jgi:phosphatidate cytidylyltransferase